MKTKGNLSSLNSRMCTCVGHTYICRGQLKTGVSSYYHVGSWDQTQIVLSGHLAIDPYHWLLITYILEISLWTWGIVPSMTNLYKKHTNKRWCSAAVCWCVRVFPLHLYLCITWVQCLKKAEGGVRSSGMEVTGSWTTMWVLRTDPRSSGRLARALNH